MTQKKELTFAINIYDENSVCPNILDSSIAQMSEDEADSLVDIALEIAMRVKHKMPYDEFMRLLVDNCEKADLI